MRRNFHSRMPSQDVVQGTTAAPWRGILAPREQKQCRIEEGHLMLDHVHIMISISPKYAISEVVGYIKGKSAIHLARVYGERKQNFVGQRFWARGYMPSTGGRDETVIREYIRNQEERLDQLNLWK